MTSKKTLDAILLMCQSLVTANLMASQGADKKKALTLIVRLDFKKTLESSDLTLDKFFDFCKDEKNHQGIRRKINLADWKHHFSFAIQSENLVREIWTTMQELPN